MTKLVLKVFITIFITIFMIGCASNGKIYSPNFNVVNQLQEKNLKKVRVEHNKDAAIIYEISLGRGTNNMLSPYTTFQEYLEKAVTENLMHAGFYSENSNISIKAKLLDNSLDTGLSTGTALLSANFKIYDHDIEKFDRIFYIKHEWQSHFVGAIAIPLTIDNYVVAMQKLVDKFLLDDDVLIILENNKQQ